MVLLAGTILEVLLGSNVKQTLQSQADYPEALSLAERLSKDVEEAKAYIEWLPLRASNILRKEEHLVAVAGLAAELSARRTVTYRKALKIIRTIVNEKGEGLLPL